MPVAEAAAHLGMAYRTATNHRGAAFLALNLTTVVELTHYAITRGWVRTGEALTSQKKAAALERIFRDGAETSNRPD